jgi:hypothetical protein
MTRGKKTKREWHMRRRIFTNDLELRNFLVDITETIEVAQPGGGPPVIPRPVDPKIVTEEYASSPLAVLPLAHYLPVIKEHLTELNKGLVAVENHRGERMTLMGFRNRALKKLSLVCRQFTNAMLARHERLELPRGDLLKVRLRDPKNMPHGPTRTGWLAIARDLIEADARFQKKGHPAMANPSAEELSVSTGETLTHQTAKK